MTNGPAARAGRSSSSTYLVWAFAGTVTVLLVIAVIAFAFLRGTGNVTSAANGTLPRVAGASLTQQAVGTWTCTQDSPPRSGGWKTATVTIDADGTFNVVYASGKTGGDGTWMLDGTTLSITFDHGSESYTGVALDSSDVIVGSDHADFAVRKTGDNEVSFQEKPIDNPDLRRFDFTCKK